MLEVMGILVNVPKKPKNPGDSIGVNIIFVAGDLLEGLQVRFDSKTDDYNLDDVRNL